MNSLNLQRTDTDSARVRKEEKYMERERERYKEESREQAKKMLFSQTANDLLNISIKYLYTKSIA